MSASKQAAPSEAPLHLIKLCVGVAEPAALEAFIEARASKSRDSRPRHTTRQKPSRAAELLAGGSLYWVMSGLIRCRQRILAIEPVTGSDGVSRVDLVLEPRLTLTASRPRRPFQGWRYLTAADAPPDLSAQAKIEAVGADAPPPELLSAISEVGVS